ncbi:MAG: hypothetical protein HC890_17910 [Chloroflexaceae bacterium]|nr:hypothetical protein [Chloroflexaceae bacterium]
MPNLKWPLGLVGALVIISCPQTLAQLETAFVSSFETGLSQWRRELCCPHSAATVTSPTRDGSYALKLTLNRTDPDVQRSKRAEIKLDPVAANSEYTYHFSLYLPDDYHPDPESEIVAQWHSRPDFDQGESWPGGPPLALHTIRGRWLLYRLWDSQPVTQHRQPEGRQKIDLGPYQTGAWTDWTFRIRWAWDGQGQISVWQGDSLLWQTQGPNTYNDRLGPYFKLGLYKPAWRWRPERSQLDQRTLYVDRVIVQRHQPFSPTGAASTPKNL